VLGETVFPRLQMLRKSLVGLWQRNNLRGSTKSEVFFSLRIGIDFRLSKHFPSTSM